MSAEAEEPERSRTEPGNGRPEAIPEEQALDPQDFQILSFESRRWASPLLKQRRIRQELGLEPRAYFRRLRQLLEDPAAQSQFPDTLGAVKSRLAESQAHYALWERAFPRADQAPDPQEEGDVEQQH